MFAFQLLLATVAAAASFYDARDIAEAGPVARAESNKTQAKFGDEYYNYWLYEADTNSYDLTRGNSTNAKTLKAGEKTITVNPGKSALLVVDMQNYFLNPAYTDFPKGLATVQPTIDSVKAFRAAGAKIIWCQWGLTDYDLQFIPPSYKISFSTDKDPEQSFGSEMGVYNGTDYGRKLVPKEYNALPYDPLWELAQEGLAAGTDLYFNKNRQSCLWGAQTPTGLYLEENQITTLFISGVNIDQCVFGTFNDAYYKGWDPIVVQDASATSSPQYAYDMVMYNVDKHGFAVNSSDIVTGLAA
ncbi:Isochorismatase-like protein [Schizophyllum amplum]|uniref:Isochorismatase-like protein n=1 Tax=Schizophyllum amplum TaxID=97359 RepID=A0A550BTW9_9AGAR|nr:Isochorismatase-like protein [Auriculariopsis ampla]